MTLSAPCVLFVLDFASEELESCVVVRREHSVLFSLMNY